MARKCFRWTKGSGRPRAADISNRSRRVVSLYEMVSLKAFAAFAGAQPLGRLMKAAFETTFETELLKIVEMDI